ncbi:MAG: DUF2269 domain-containing protein [Asticcacaulis sp.]
MLYLWIKWIHVLSSTILFGTGIGTAFFMFMANRRKDVAGIAFASRHVVIADWCFTTPAVIIQLLTGLWLVHLGGFELFGGWVLGGLVLYFFAGACWLPVVWMQIRMRDMAQIALKENTPLPPLYWRFERWWVIMGSLAFPAIVVVFYLMVVKP